MDSTESIGSQFDPLQEILGAAITAEEAVEIALHRDTDYSEYLRLVRIALGPSDPFDDPNAKEKFKLTQQLLDNPFAYRIEAWDCMKRHVIALTGWIAAQNHFQLIAHQPAFFFASDYCPAEIHEEAIRIAKEHRFRDDVSLLESITLVLGAAISTRGHLPDRNPEKTQALHDRVYRLVTGGYHDGQSHPNPTHVKKVLAVIGQAADDRMLQLGLRINAMPSEIALAPEIVEGKRWAWWQEWIETAPKGSEYIETCQNLLANPDLTPEQRKWILQAVHNRGENYWWIYWNAGDEGIEFITGLPQKHAAPILREVCMGLNFQPVRVQKAVISLALKYLTELGEPIKTSDMRVVRSLYSDMGDLVGPVLVRNGARQIAMAIAQMWRPLDEHTLSALLQHPDPSIRLALLDRPLSQVPDLDVIDRFQTQILGILTQDSSWRVRWKARWVGWRLRGSNA